MKPIKITKRFNVALFLYFGTAITINALFEPESKEKVPWDFLYDWSPLFAITVATLMAIILALWSAVLVRILWNRFISDVFTIREISFDESLAVVLMIAILSI